jgi:hypothetical protein
MLHLTKCLRVFLDAAASGALAVACSARVVCTFIRALLMPLPRSTWLSKLSAGERVLRARKGIHIMWQLTPPYQLLNCVRSMFCETVYLVNNHIPTVATSNGMILILPGKTRNKKPFLVSKSQIWELLLLPIENIILRFLSFKWWVQDQCLVIWFNDSKSLSDLSDCKCGAARILMLHRGYSGLSKQ